MVKIEDGHAEYLAKLQREQRFTELTNIFFKSEKISAQIHGKPLYHSGVMRIDFKDSGYSLRIDLYNNRISLEDDCHIKHVPEILKLAKVYEASMKEEFKIRTSRPEYHEAVKKCLEGRLSNS